MDGFSARSLSLAEMWSNSAVYCALHRIVPYCRFLKLYESIIVKRQHGRMDRRSLQHHLRASYLTSLSGDRRSARGLLDAHSSINVHFPGYRPAGYVRLVHGSHRRRSEILWFVGFREHAHAQNRARCKLRDGRARSKFQGRSYSRIRLELRYIFNMVASPAC